MNFPFWSIAILIAALMVIPLYRVVAGPTAFDRLLAAGLIGTNSILLLVIIGFIYRRVDMFVDLALVYSLLNFVVTIATGKYLERKRQGTI